MEIIFNEKGATFKPIKCTKVHKKWHAKINSPSMKKMQL